MIKSLSLINNQFFLLYIVDPFYTLFGRDFEKWIFFRCKVYLSIIIICVFCLFVVCIRDFYKNMFSMTLKVKTYFILKILWKIIDKKMFKSTSRNRQSAGYSSQQKHLMLKKSLIKYLKHHSNRYYSFFRIGFLSNRKMLFTINTYITHTIRQDV